MLPRGESSLPYCDEAENETRIRRLERERAVLEEGEALLRAKLRQQWISKLQDQQEARELLRSYAPWGRPGCGAPSNDHDVRRKKVHDGQIIGVVQQSQGPSTNIIPSLALGRPGCGAPLRTRSGRLQVAWRADPSIRFLEPARRCVDNELRYRVSPSQQQAYRSQLDQLVAEQRKAEKEARKNSSQAIWRMGWGSEPVKLDSLSAPEVQRRQQKPREPRKAGVPCESHSPPSSKQDGTELVPLLTRRKAQGLHTSLVRHPLSSTDITRHQVPGISEPRMHEDKELLQTLHRQVNCKKKQLEELRESELESNRRHFETWRQFWGRPGHGAPRAPVPRISLAQLLSEEPLRGVPALRK